MSNIVVFPAESQALTYEDRKGALHAITAEGCLFRGGLAVLALKEAALESALVKAGNGRYRAAADIIAAAFPGAYRAADKCVGTPWANKTTMQTLLGAVRNTKEPAKKWSAKQAKVRLLCAALDNIPALKVEAAEPVTIEA